MAVRHPQSWIGDVEEDVHGPTRRNDFGIIVDAAVILVENVYRNFQARPEEREVLLAQLAEGRWGADPTATLDSTGSSPWTDRLRLILISALQIDKAVFFSTAIIVAAFIPLFTMQSVEGQIFSPMARTYGYALVGALLATFTVTPCLASLLLPEHVSEVETIVVRAIRAVYTPVLRWSLTQPNDHGRLGSVFLVVVGFLGSRLGSEFLPTLEEGNLWIRASMPPTISLEAGNADTSIGCARSSSSIRKSSRSCRSTAGRTTAATRLGFSTPNSSFRSSRSTSGRPA